VGYPPLPLPPEVAWMHAYSVSLDPPRGASETPSETKLDRACDYLRKRPRPV
jgi:hypothetical protein